MKNLFLIISILFFLGNPSLAQNKIDEAIFNNLVDYVSCKYAVQYIHNYTPKKDKELKGYDIIKKQWNGQNLESQISFNRFKEVLVENEWGGTAKKIQDWKDKKKFSEVRERNNAEILNYIIQITEQEPLKKSIDDKFIVDLKNELCNKYLGSIESSSLLSTVPNLEIDTLKDEIRSIKQTIDDLKKSSRNTLIETIQWGIMILFIGIFIAPKLFRRLKNKVKVDKPLRDNDKEYIINTVLGSTQIANHFKPQKVPPTTVKNYTLDENQITIVVDRVMEIIRLDEAEKRKEEIKENTDSQKQSTTSKSEVKYLKEKEGLLIFKETSEENAYYELFNIAGNKADYRFCGNEERAIANYDAILKDIFDDEKTYFSKARGILNTVSGLAEMQADGKWKIINPAKIKLI